MGMRAARASAKGMTLVELMLAVTFIGILATMVAGRVVPLINRFGAGNISSVIALDLEQAVTLAARQRKPIRISVDPATQSYTFADRATGAVLFRRAVGGGAGGTVSGLSFSVSPVDVFPSGLTSAALTVTLSAGSTTRRVTMSTGGFVRVIR